MKDEGESAEDFPAIDTKRQQMRLAANSLQHYLKITAEQANLDEIVAAIRQSIAGELGGGDTDDLDGLLVSQAKLLDATFHFFLDKAKSSPYSQDDQVNMALKAQRQSERTIKTLRRLRQQKIKKLAERTGINSDAGA